MAPFRAIDGFLFAPEAATRLAGLRIGLFALLAIRMASTDVDLVAGQPQALFDPVSLFHLVDRMPSAELASVVQPLAIGAALCAAFGAAPRISFPIAIGAAVFLELMLNSTGKIIHNEVLLVLALLPLLAAPRAATAAWSLRSWRLARAPRSSTNQERAAGVQYGWPVRAAMLIVALAYLFAGLQKLRYSGLDWATGENLHWVLYSASDSQSSPNAIGLFIADHSWMYHALAAGSMVLELGFISCLVIPRLRWIFVPGVVSLHAGIWLTMGLDYSAQALTAVIVFVNWPLVSDWILTRLADLRLKPAQP